jgi:hypothetical protein
VRNTSPPAGRHAVREARRTRPVLDRPRGTAITYLSPSGAVIGRKAPRQVGEQDPQRPGELVTAACRQRRHQVILVAEQFADAAVDGRALRSRRLIAETRNGRAGTPRRWRAQRRPGKRRPGGSCRSRRAAGRPAAGRWVSAVLRVQAAGQGLFVYAEGAGFLHRISLSFRSLLIRGALELSSAAFRLIVRASAHKPGGPAKVSASLAAMSSIAWSAADSTPQKFKNACIVAWYSTWVTSTPSASRRAA